MTDRIQQMIEVQQTGLELFKRKNADYGDAFAKYGTIGVLMRIEDKIQIKPNRISIEILTYKNEYPPFHTSYSIKIKGLYCSTSDISKNVMLCNYLIDILEKNFLCKCYLSFYL